MPNPPAAEIADYRERVTRRHILDAARSAFASAGYEAQIRDIVDAGSFSMSTLYRYFPDGKDQIVLDLYAQMVDEVRADMACVNQITDARAALEAWMDAGFEKVDRYGLLASAIATGHQPTPHRGTLPILDLYRFTGRLIKQAIAQQQLGSQVAVREAVRVWFALVAPGRIHGCLRDGMSTREIRDLSVGYFFKLFGS